MADPEHLAILKKGVDAWNHWRIQNRDVPPDLSNTDLSEADLSGTNLMGADLSGAFLRKTILRKAQLCEALLANSDFLSADLTEADIRGAFVFGTRFIDTSLRNAEFEYAFFIHAAFGNNDLSETRGLERTTHYGPSIIGVDTIYRSKGGIPHEFLRGCGVPENFITYMHSLVGQPLQFYSCFISYTEKDDGFSERLYNDLQARGVRCWRWREDAKWGKSIWGSVDEAVRMYDKLVVVCSKHSLGGKAPAVLEEIDRALTKEDEHVRAGKPSDVLFPITLDDFLFKRWEHERKGRVLKKHVGDFRKWKDPTAYQAALKRLIRDLAAEPAAVAKKGK